jgi:hypothetical protein
MIEENEMQSLSDVYVERRIVPPVKDDTVRYKRALHKTLDEIKDEHAESRISMAPIAFFAFLFISALIALAMYVRAHPEARITIGKWTIVEPTAPEVVEPPPTHAKRKK